MMDGLLIGLLGFTGMAAFFTIAICLASLLKRIEKLEEFERQRRVRKGEKETLDGLANEAHDKLKAEVDVQTRTNNGLQQSYENSCKTIEELKAKLADLEADNDALREVTKFKDHKTPHIMTACVRGLRVRLAEAELWLTDYEQLRIDYDAAKEQLAEADRALVVLYEHTADYIRVNNLGDVHHNQCMEQTRAYLAKYPNKE